MNPISTNLSHRPFPYRDAQGNIIPSSYGDLAFEGDYTGTNLIYKGQARPGSATSNAVWQISKSTYDGSNNLTSIKWPQTTAGIASSDFSFVWDDRASYTYS